MRAVRHHFLDLAITQLRTHPPRNARRQFFPPLGVLYLQGRSTPGPFTEDDRLRADEIGRASCRERVYLCV
jgi:hypothetical protein